jgi:CRP-like cAMP-binding protein
MPCLGAAWRAKTCMMARRGTCDALTGCRTARPQIGVGAGGELCHAFRAGMGRLWLPRPRGGDNAINVRLGMTRQDMAEYLGLTIETVSRAFSELRRRDVVAIDKHEEVRVNDI